jgi:hypothetical protein
MIVLLVGFAALLATLFAASFWGITFAHALLVYYVVGGSVLLLLTLRAVWSPRDTTCDQGLDCINSHQAPKRR